MKKRIVIIKKECLSTGETQIKYYVLTKPNILGRVQIEPVFFPYKIKPVETVDKKCIEYI